MANLRVDKITSTETFEKTGSVQFDGANDHLDVGSAGDFNYLHDNTASFTAEFWVYPQVVNSRQTIFSTGGNSSSTGFCVRIMASGDAGSSNGYLIGAQTSKSSSGNYLYWDSDSTQLDADTWYHIAIVYDNTDETLKIYVNGKLTNSGFPHVEGTFGSHSTSNSSYSLHIGEEPYGNSLDLTGHISNLRILNGVKLYTANFKPSMRELEVTPETTLLCCQSKNDAALEKTGKTTTANGNAVASELTPGILTPVPKAGGGSAITGSVEFDGESILESTSPDFAMGDSDLTMECWFYNGVDTITHMVQIDVDGGATNFSLATRDAAAGDVRFLVRNDSGSNLSDLIGGAPGAKINAWHHLAGTIEGTTTRLFLNGVLIKSGTISGTRTHTGDKLTLGANEANRYLKGYLSNVRIVRGTALYTKDFIPPTRDLKRVPGTVLLSCQDPDNPLTEATGKTITPYGNLGDGSLGGELVTNNSVWTLTKGGSGATDWTVSNNGRSLAGTTVSGGYIRATYTIPQGDYLVSLRWTGGNFAVQDSTGYIVATDGTDTDFGSSEDGAYSFYMSDTTSVVITGTSWSTAYTVDDISIKRIYKNNGASNFTPQVGNDRKVTLEGVTKINSDAYFYLPTGDTVTRESRYGRSRGLIVGGGNSDTIEFINIASTGNAQDYGNLSATTSYVSALSSSTRGVYSRSRTPSSPGGDNTLEYSTLASTGNSIDFGDRTEAVYDVGALSNSIRGIIGGGYGPDNSDVIDYVTISSTGNALDFGNLTQARRSIAGLASPTRGCLAGGYQQPDTTTETAAIDYLTIASTGNALDFGDLTAARWGAAPMASSTRGVFAGGIDPNALNLIDYITIASTGNANDFGDISQHATGRNTGISNSVRGVAGIYLTPAYQNTWQYITIQSMGNAQDFGESAVDNSGLRGGCSDSHGGLG